LPWTFASFLHHPCHLFESVIRTARSLLVLTPGARGPFGTCRFG
jgi:hypothetical protein